MGLIDIFLFYSWRAKTQRTSVLLGMRNEHGSIVPKQKRVKRCSSPLMCLYSSNALVQHMMLISIQVSNYHFSHIHLFISPRMNKSSGHHFWNLGRKWLNMVSTDTCTCIHQNYFSYGLTVFEGGWSQLMEKWRTRCVVYEDFRCKSL